MMVYCNGIGIEEIKRRKTASDAKNNTDSLTFDSSNNNVRASAYCAIRNINDELEIKRLLNSTNDSEMLEELNRLEKEFIDC